jgi:transposase-like protein
MADTGPHGAPTLGTAAVDAPEARARELVEEIRSQVANLTPAIRELWDCWNVLRDPAGRPYESWTDMCRAEFDGVVFPPQLRQAVVKELVEDGMSNRAVAAAVNVDEGTVRNDVKQLRNDSAVDLPARRRGQDGRTRKPPTKPAVTVSKPANRATAPEPQPTPPKAPTAAPRGGKRASGPGRKLTGDALDEQLAVAVKILTPAVVALTDGTLHPQAAAQVLVANLRPEPKVLDALVAFLTEAVNAR